jgi:hypothetical protein
MKMRTLACRIFGATFGAVAWTLALAAPCDAPAHREFDFWLGEWEVRTPDGKLAGTNRIEREHDGCVLRGGSAPSDRFLVGISGSGVAVDDADVVSLRESYT